MSRAEFVDAKVLLFLRAMEWADAGPLFNPSLWKQRRTKVHEILKEHKATSIIDYGCGEGLLISFLIPSSDDYCITRLAGIDISMESLKIAASACRPWQKDYEELRETPLSIDLYHGSIAAADRRLLSYSAIACCEVVEHLYPSVLSRFFIVTLGTYKPPLLIVTTPNAEFNVNFPQLKYGTPEATLRNEDHKFEWTRAEFEAWCRSGANEYGYDVTFTGVGQFQHFDPAIGHATQIAIFTDSHPTAPPKYTDFGTYILLEHFEFPYYQGPKMCPETCLDVIGGYLEYLVSCGEDGRPLLELKDLWCILKIRQICRTKDWLREILESSDEFEMIDNERAWVLRKDLVELVKETGEVSWESSQCNIEANEDGDDWVTKIGWEVVLDDPKNFRNVINDDSGWGEIKGVRNEWCT